ncbi:MAG: hypothetical protein PHH05_06715 [Syntrophaceticus sp.]|nr:hypothetical protein [Syntrophaceticus sp.]
MPLGGTKVSLGIGGIRVAREEIPVSHWAIPAKRITGSLDHRDGSPDPSLCNIW